MTNPPVVLADRRKRRRPMLKHPARVLIVFGVLLIVGNLALFLLEESDTSREGRTFPIAIDTVNPLPGEILRPQDTITADLRTGLTGVLVIDRIEVPEDQLDRVEPLGEVSFRPGPGKELERFEPGIHTIVVRYWEIGKQRPASPSSYSWSVVVSA
jgi:hypothetical protein